MRRIVLVPLALSGCGLFEPVVAVGVVHRVEEARPLPADHGLPETWAVGVGASLFLAEANLGLDPDVTGIAGAELWLNGCDEAVPLEDEGNGAYHVAGVLEGCGERIFDAVAAAEAARLTVTLPDAPDLDVPRTWPHGHHLMVDLDGEGWDAAVADLIDLETGEVIWSDRPTKTAEWRRLLTGKREPGTLVVPDEVLRPGRYVLAVTGVVKMPGRALAEVNPAFSAVAGGHVSLWPLEVPSP